MKKQTTRLAPGAGSPVPAKPEEPPKFALVAGNTLTSADGSYALVVAMAMVKGEPVAILEQHTVTGDRAPHPKLPGTSAGHGAIPVSDIEAQVKAGKLKVGTAP